MADSLSVDTPELLSVNAFEDCLPYGIGRVASATNGFTTMLEITTDENAKGHDQHDNSSPSDDGKSSPVGGGETLLWPSVTHRSLPSMLGDHAPSIEVVYMLLGGN